MIQTQKRPSRKRVAGKPVEARFDYGGKLPHPVLFAATLLFFIFAALRCAH